MFIKIITHQFRQNAVRSYTLQSLKKALREENKFMTKKLRLWGFRNISELFEPRVLATCLKAQSSLPSWREEKK